MGSDTVTPRPSSRPLLVVLTLVVAIGVVGLIVSLGPGGAPSATASPGLSGAPPNSAPTSPTTVASPSALSSADPSVQPSAMPGAEIDLAEVTWYTVVPVAFGYLTGSGADESPLPSNYDEVTIGTLDGRVTTQLHLSSRLTDEGHQGAWANGPHGDAVLVGDDDGQHTRVFTVSSRDAAQTTLLETDDAVVAGALAADGSVLYFVPVDRATGLDRGLWRAPVGQPAAAEEVHAGPIATTPEDFASQWTMDASTDGRFLVTQVCNRQRCSTLVLDTTGDTTRKEPVDDGRIIGTTDDAYVTRHSAVSLATGERSALGLDAGGSGTVAGMPGAWFVVFEPDDAGDPRAYSLVAVPVGGGRPRVLVEIDSSEPTDARLNLRPGAGVGLPSQWVLRWPTAGARYSDIAVPPEAWYAGEIVNVVSGERVPAPPTAWSDGVTECEPVAPRALPSGAAPGDPTITVGGHQTWATWGSGTPDQVVQVVGSWMYAAPPNSGPGSAVTVRGHPGRVVAMGSIDGPWAIAWEESGCRYEVQLAPGVTMTDAIDYAARYG